MHHNAATKNDEEDEDEQETEIVALSGVVVVDFGVLVLAEPPLDRPKMVRMLFSGDDRPRGGAASLDLCEGQRWVRTKPTYLLRCRSCLLLACWGCSSSRL